jgi:hypothetical protein
MVTKLSKQVSKRALAGCLATGLAIATGISALAPTPTSAQETTGGITIFGGVDPDYRLGYSIDFNQPYSNRARYYLRVTGDKLPRDVTELTITYPSAFNEMQGKLNCGEIKLRKGRYRGDEDLPLDDVVCDDEAKTVQIFPEEPIPANTSLVIVFDRVNNPRRYGIHYFNLKLMYQGDVLPQYVGTWTLEVAAEQ